MSKSSGNFYTLRDLFHKGYTGAQVRYLLLSSHYRTQFNFTFQGLDAAKATLQRIEDFLIRIREIKNKTGDDREALLSQADSCFRAALAEDLNISSALSVLFDLIREVNILCDKNAFSEAAAQKVLHLLEEWNLVLGLPLEIESTPPELISLLEIREKARKEKNFVLSDQIRATLIEKGYIIEDTPLGPRLKLRTST
jgi:cysteinyl-tRNA synthetase